MVASPRADRVAYDESVFINCPFTPDHGWMLRAYVFAVMDCGLRPRCAREGDDGGEVRIDKIVRIVRTCRWAIHDLSLTGLDPRSGLARFNMPFELGLFLGAQRFGKGQRDKQSVIFERLAHETKVCLSDISGQDCREHGGSAEAIVRQVRDWLRTARGMMLPGADSMAERFALFEVEFPVLCTALRLNAADIVFVDLCEVIRCWIAENG